jgi:hypothetical protein
MNSLIKLIFKNFDQIKVGSFNMKKQLTGDSFA